MYPLSVAAICSFDGDMRRQRCWMLRCCFWAAATWRLQASSRLAAALMDSPISARDAMTAAAEVGNRRLYYIIGTCELSVVFVSRAVYNRGECI